MRDCQASAAIDNNIIRSVTRLVTRGQGIYLIIETEHLHQRGFHYKRFIRFGTKAGLLILPNSSWLLGCGFS